MIKRTAVTLVLSAGVVVVAFEALGSDDQLTIAMDLILSF